MRLMRLTPFCAADGGGGAAAGSGTAAQTGQQETQNQNQSQTPAVDYDRIAQILEGKQAATEESVLKGYFKQQGLTKEQMDQAITAFKQQQAANQPDVNAMQTQLAEAQQAAKQAQIQNAATMAAVSLGLEVKTIPYVLKMADLSQVMGQDGKISDEAMKNALDKVLEDVPALKTQPGQPSGFIQVGAGGQGQQQTATDDALKKAFGLQ